MLTTQHILTVYQLSKILADPQKEAIKALLDHSGISYTKLSEAVNHPSAAVVLEAEGNRVGISLPPSEVAVARGEELIAAIVAENPPKVDEVIEPKAPATPVKSATTVVKKK